MVDDRHFFETKLASELAGEFACSSLVAKIGDGQDIIGTIFSRIARVAQNTSRSKHFTASGEAANIDPPNTFCRRTFPRFDRCFGRPNVELFFIDKSQWCGRR